VAEHDTERVEVWGRRSSIRLEELPKSDPIAYLGTDRHPISVPPTSRDVETPHPQHPVEEHPGKSHVARRALIAAICALIIVPAAFSLTSSSDTNREAPPAAEPTARLSALTQAPPAQGREATPEEAAVRSDLPPGGLPEVSAPDLPADDQRSVADWTGAPPKNGVAATAPDRKTDTAVFQRVEAAHGAFDDSRSP